MSDDQKQKALAVRVKLLQEVESRVGVEQWCDGLLWLAEIMLEEGGSKAPIR